MLVLVGWLMISGTVHEWHRYKGLPSPEWVALVWLVFPVAGAAVGLALLWYVWQTLRVMSGPGAAVDVARTEVPTLGEASR